MVAILMFMFGYDLTILHSVQSWQSPGLTIVMRIASWVFTPEIIIPVLAMVCAYLFVRRRRLQDMLFFLLLSGNSLTLILKLVFHRLRPTTSVAQVLDRQGSYSFPSGHAVAVMIVCLSVLLLTSQKWRRHRWWLSTLAVCLTVLVGISRVYLGAHWPSDVLAGYIIGILWVLFIWLAIKPFLEHWWARHKIQQLSSTIV